MNELQKLIDVAKTITKDDIEKIKNKVSKLPKFRLNEFFEFYGIEAGNTPIHYLIIQILYNKWPKSLKNYNDPQFFKAVKMYLKKQPNKWYFLIKKDKLKYSMDELNKITGTILFKPRTICDWKET